MTWLFRIAGYGLALWVLRWLLGRMQAAFVTAMAGEAAAGGVVWMWFAAYLAAAGLLGLGLAWDVTRQFGLLAGQLYVGSGRLPAFTAAWWRAERLARTGQTMAAIQTLRDYLDAHPRHWPVAVRIAELYERELDDPQSAALQYEAILQRRLPHRVRAELMLRRANCALLARDADAAAGWWRAVIAQFPDRPAAVTAVRRLARLEAQTAQPEAVG